MSDNIGGVFVALGFGIYLFFKGFKWHAQKKLIDDTPTSKIRSIAMGDVEIYGEAIALNNKEFVKSPFTLTPCLYYKYTIERYQSSKNGGHWVQVQSGEDRTLFYLKDDTDKVLINIKEAEVDIPLDFETYSNSLNVDTKNNILKVFNLGLGLSRHRFREYYIVPKDKLYIFGRADVNKLVDVGTAKTNCEGIMIGKSKTMFYVSDKSEKDVLSKFKWKVIGGLFGGSSLILVSLLILFSYFKIL